jgi:CHAP domain
MADNWLSYTFGNCTRYVAEKYSWIPAGLGNAKDWLANAQAKGLTISNIPVPGAVAVYGSGIGPFGHVAAVEGVNPDGTFNVSEMNFDAFNTVDRRTSTMKNVIGFILPPGSTATTSNFPGLPGGFQPLPFLPGTDAAAGIANSITAISNGVGPILKWVTTPANWWRVGFVGVGVAMIIGGMFVYFIQEEAPAIERGAEVAAV